MKYKAVFLLLILLLLENVAFCQDIYLVGNLRKNDCDKIKSLTTSIRSNFKADKIKYFYNSKPFFFLSKKINNADILLDAKLDSICKSGHILKSPIADEITKSTKDIILSNNDKQLIIFNKIGEDKSPSYFNDFEKLLAYLDEQKKTKNKVFRKNKYLFLIALSKEKPTVKINFPQNNSSTCSNKIEGIADGVDQLKEIQIRVNNAQWFKANGTASWDLEPSLQKGENTIEAISIDNLQDTSIIDKIIFKNRTLRTPLITYLYPNDLNYKPEKCKYSGNYRYKFKFSLDQCFSPENLIIRMEDSLHNKISETLLKDIISLGEFEKTQVKDYVEYCFYLSYKITGYENTCFPDQDLYYLFKSSLDDKVIKLPTRLQVTFSSFKESKVADCNCE
jgi:hypothetical protein